MSKVSIVERQKRREALVAKYASKRAALKAQVVDGSLSLEQRWEAQKQLQQLPRNASPVRLVNRCQLTGRPRGVFRRFQLGRNKLREMAMRGDVPGVVKASW